MSEDETPDAPVDGGRSRETDDTASDTPTAGVDAADEDGRAGDARADEPTHAAERTSAPTAQSLRALVDRASERDDDLAADVRGVVETVEHQREELEDLRERVDTQSETIDELREELDGKERSQEEKADRIDELETALKRKQADFQNYKKRTKKRQEQIKARATEDLVNRIVSVRDNLKRALDEEGDLETFRDGVEMTLKEFDRIMADENVTPIEPEPGSEVDPQCHEVMVQVDSAQPEGTIAEVFTPGYEMGEKVIQNAQVTVSKGNLDPEDERVQDDQTDESNADGQASDGTGDEDDDENERGVHAEASDETQSTVRGRSDSDGQTTEDGARARSGVASDGPGSETNAGAASKDSAPGESSDSATDVKTSRASTTESEAEDASEPRSTTADPIDPEPSRASNLFELSEDDRADVIDDDSTGDAIWNDSGGNSLWSDDDADDGRRSQNRHQRTSPSRSRRASERMALGKDDLSSESGADDADDEEDEAIELGGRIADDRQEREE